MSVQPLPIPTGTFFGRRPTDYLSHEGVEYPRQIELAFLSPQVGDIASNSQEATMKAWERLTVETYA